MNAFLSLSLLLVAQPQESVVRFRALPNQGREIVARLPAGFKLPMGKLTQEQGEGILTVALVDEDSKQPGPAMLGKYERKGNELTFTPRFPLVGGQTYRADFHHPDKLLTLDYRMPPPAPKSPPQVVKIYPTADVLPANHLKFYVYFDRPMRGGKELFNQIVLVDDKGKVIDDPWLMDEIWDEENNCLIIYIHPGRIKWGVELRELLGPVLFEKRNYSLVIRGELTDLDGNKIGKDVVKKFRTTPEDRVRIDVQSWTRTGPNLNTRDPLTLNLRQSLDHRSLQKFLTVTDDKGQRVDGAITLGKDEKIWTFTPKGVWQNRTYQYEVHPDTEDVAGNTPSRPFDLDLKAPKMPPQKLRFDFVPR